MDNTEELEYYVLYLDERTYCYFDTCSSGTPLPQVRTSSKRWKHYYEVVRALE
jgi:hypothetical protein